VRLIGLHHVQLAMPTGEENKARAFYTGLLLLREVEKPAALAGRGGCWFESGTLRIHLGVETQFAPARKAHPALQVEGLDDWASRLTEGGAPVLWDSDLPGYRRFYTADPFGNRIEMLEPTSN
jgi:catechol 2,3-dioxygenase-like lactoylglutathione lyase family enzyme